MLPVLLGTQHSSATHNGVVLLWMRLMFSIFLLLEDKKCTSVVSDRLHHLFARTGKLS